MRQLGNTSPKLDKLEAAKILENIFDECEVEQNTVPMEELTSYSNYRKESFTLQRIILIVALVCFILLPFLFIEPRFRVQFEEKGERGLPVYTIDVETHLPVAKVLAVQNGYRLPVYEVNPHCYTVEPTSNGTVDLTVELFNRQSKSQKLVSQHEDTEEPYLTAFSKEEDGSYIYIADDGSGIAYEEIYAVLLSGEQIKPDAYDSEKGYIYFSEDLKGAEIYVYDNYKNLLCIKL